MYHTNSRSSGKHEVMLEEYRKALESGENVLLVDKSSLRKPIRTRSLLSDTYIDRDILTYEQIRQAEDCLKMFLEK